MLRWLAPRLPPRRHRINLHNLLLDSGKSKVSFNQIESPALELRLDLQSHSSQAKSRSINPLVVYNSLPPAPADDLFRPNSSLCPPFHIHLHEDETFRVLLGKAVFLLVDGSEQSHHEPQDATTAESVFMGQDYRSIGIRSCTLSRGSSITIPRGQIHTFRNASTTCQLELEFGFSLNDSDPEIFRESSFESREVRTLSDTHLAPIRPVPEVHVDHTQPSMRYRPSVKATGNVKASTDNSQGLELRSKPALPIKSSTIAISEISPTDSETFKSHGVTSSETALEITNTFHSGQGPLRSPSEPETPLISPHSVSTKMLRFFLNTQLYRADCTAHSIPRALPQLLLFNHAAGVILVPSWLLRNRFLRPFASVIGRMMNLIIGVVYGCWICGLKDTYSEYTEPGSLEVMVKQAEDSIKDLRTDAYELEQRLKQDHEARKRLKEIEESGLVCSAWKSHEFDGQDESWRKSV